MWCCLTCACPGMNGLEAARHMALLPDPPAVVFTTAYDAYAVEAFEAQAVGYLLKPIRAEKLGARARRAPRGWPESSWRVSRRAIRDMPPARTWRRRLGDQVRLIPVPEIYYFAADQKYTTVRHQGGTDLIEDSLRTLEEEFARAVRARAPQRAGQHQPAGGDRARCAGPVPRGPARHQRAPGGEPAAGGRIAGEVPAVAMPQPRRQQLARGVRPDRNIGRWIAGNQDADDDVKVLHEHGLRAGALAAPESVLELRDLLLDHLHPVRCASIRSLRRHPARAVPRSGLGWPLGVMISGMFGLAMAQIASAFPTAGGLYHWGSILGNRFTGWLTAWFNLLGLITVLGAINVGSYYFFLGAFGPVLGTGPTPCGRWSRSSACSAAARR